MSGSVISYDSEGKDAPFLIASESMLLCGPSDSIAIIRAARLSVGVNRSVLSRQRVTESELGQNSQSLTTASEGVCREGPSSDGADSAAGTDVIESRGPPPERPPPSMPPSTVVSSPGKVLLAGGYLVLDPHYQGVVVATSSRFYTAVLDAAVPPQTRVHTPIQIRVRSPQFVDATWIYLVHIDQADVRVEQVADESVPPLPPLARCSPSAAAGPSPPPRTNSSSLLSTRPCVSHGSTTAPRP